MSKTIKVAVTGAAGAIGYAIVPRIASGEVFGPDTKVILHLLELPDALSKLEGVAMELDDCAFPLLESMVVTDNLETAFDGVSWALLIGSKPRTKGMERNDLIRDNGPIFVGQGKALEAKASTDVRVVVVGNPCNTNALIAMKNAPGIPQDRFSAMTRLDQNRTMAQMARKAGVGVSAVTNVAIWGNHSATQYPDAENAKINGRPVPEVITDTAWIQGDLIKTVQQRGAAIINARGSSSAMSAANAAIDHVKALITPTAPGDWFSAAIPSDGSYGIEPGLLFSYPLRSAGDGNWTIVQGLPISEFAAEKIAKTKQELLEEKAVVADLLA
jgi:malate dehydrogenase